MRHFLVHGLVRQKDGSYRREAQVRAVPDGREPHEIGLPRRACREMERAPEEHESPDGKGWKLDEAAKAKADEAARLAAMTRAELVEHILASINDR